MFQSDTSRLQIAHDYFDHSLQEYHYDLKTGKGCGPAGEAPADERKGVPSQFEFHWTVSDYIRAMLKGGFQLLEMYEEPSDGILNWKNHPLEALPSGFTLVARKKKSGL